MQVSAHPPPSVPGRASGGELSVGVSQTLLSKEGREGVPGWGASNEPGYELVMVLAKPEIQRRVPAPAATCNFAQDGKGISHLRG